MAPARAPCPALTPTPMSHRSVRPCLAATRADQGAYRLQATPWEKTRQRLRGPVTDTQEVNLHASTRACPVLHCDLDAFFASVEQAVRPELRGTPVAVSAARGQAVVTAASYEAKRVGVRTGMHLRDARRHCPDLVFVQARMEAYQRVGALVADIIRSTGAAIESLGIDECFLSVGDVDPARVDAPDGLLRDSYGEDGLAMWTARWIKKEVARSTGLAVTVGGGTNKTVAKLASDTAKPDGLKIVDPADELGFLHSSQLTAVAGIGPRSAARLTSLGFSTLGDLVGMSRRSLVAILGKHQGGVVFALAANQHRDPVSPNPKPKTTSSMRSFGSRPQPARVALDELLAEVLNRLRTSGRAARTVSVFAADQSRIYKAHHDSRAPTADLVELAAAARRMIREVPEDFTAVYAGVTLEGLSDVSQPRLPIATGWLDDEDLRAPLQVVQPTTAERLQRAAFLNMAVEHPVFGTGRVAALRDSSVVVEFSDRERELELWSPVGF